MIFNRFERTVGFRYLRAHRREGVVSVMAIFSFLGILLGVATLVIVMAVMNGFREQLTTQILGFNGHLGVYAVDSQKGIENATALAEQIKQIPGVTSATPLIERHSIALKGQTAFGVLVHGIEPQDLKARTLIAEHIILGSLKSFDQEFNILIGRHLAEKLGVFPGDQLTLVSPAGTSTAFGFIPRLRSFLVSGVFEVGMYQFDSSTAFIPLSSAQKFFQVTAPTTIEVFTKNPDHVAAIRPHVEELIENATAKVYDWRQVNETFFTALEVEKNVMFFILLLIVTIAVFNIISGLIIFVKDKSHDIAILRTMGATRGMILRIFFLTGASIGIAGTLAGVILGLLFSAHIDTIRQGLEYLTGTHMFNAEIYFLSTLPAKVNPYDVVTITCLSLALSFVGTFYPSWRAARLDPVEALRYE